MRSTRTRLGAAITAGVALSAIGVLSMTSGTVAELSDSIDVTAEVGVAGEPYGIARGVSYSVNFQRLAGGYASEAENESTSVDSRSGPARQFTEVPGVHNVLSGGLDFLDPLNVRACASSNFDGNLTRCPGASATGALVSASSGNAKTVEKYKAQWKDIASPAKQILETHDIFTHVECNADGTVTAAAPTGSWNFGGTETLRTRKWGFFEAGTGRSNAGDLPNANTYARYRLWTGNNSTSFNTSMTVEVQSIARVLNNPPRAVSALVFYVSAGNEAAQNRLTDMALVSKSECAVSEDGTEITDEVFEPLIPASKPQPLPRWTGSWNYFLQPTSPIVENFVAGQRNALAQPEPSIDLLESGDIETATPEGTDSANPDASVIAPTSSAPSPTSPVQSSTSRVSTFPTTLIPTRTATTASSEPAPTPKASPTSSPGYTTADGRLYRTADGGTLTGTQRALVEEAVAAADTADRGDLADGASYAVTANQLDGTTLIVTTASGGTLRIVWGK